MLKFAPCRVIQESLGSFPDSTLWIPSIPRLWIRDSTSVDSGFHIIAPGFYRWLDSRFQNSILGSGYHQLDSGSQSRGFRNHLDSGLPYMGRKSGCFQSKVKNYATTKTRTKTEDQNSLGQSSILSSFPFSDLKVSNMFV